ncbi:helix-turn-helix domain-containing protein [Acidovorax sp. YS12]|nr:helix-turn-helix domain-containing protein [Acidovorax sp. YS12]
MHMGERIKEERERLGFNQSDFAALATATRKTLFNWESGAAAPNATVLATWAAHGLDVLYVVTGQRTQPAAPQVTLSPRKAALLDHYDHSDESGKKIIEAAAFAAAKPTTAARKSKAA